MVILAVSMVNLDNIPDLPGVYKFMGWGGEVLYVGKARSLRRRVLSYFQRAKDPHCDYKTRLLVERAESLEWVVTESEWDALLLENNLIKAYQPRFNVLLKDGKTYPSICITKEPYPRVLFVRQRVQEGEYFGPFPWGGLARRYMRLFQEVYGLRDCDLLLEPGGVEAGRYRPCVRAYLRTCKAPCIGRQSHAAYLDMIAQIRAILSGRWEEAAAAIEARIQEAVARLAFEEAHAFRQHLDQLRQHQRESLVVDERLGDAEMLSIVAGSRVAVIHHLSIAQGRIVASHVWQVQAKAWESHPEEVLEQSVGRIVALRGRLAPVVWVDGWPARRPLPESYEWAYAMPQEEPWTRLAYMCRQTAFTLLEQKQAFLDQQGAAAQAVLEALQETLGLPTLPRRIECIDNSHLQGSHLVSAVVVFVEGRPQRSAYRRYIHRDLCVGDDYEAMRRTIRRRYEKRLIRGELLPDLLLIDGGKGQLQAAVEVLASIGVRIPTFALAKKKEEIFGVGQAEPLRLPRHDAVLRLLQAIRDETHRTAVGFHRARREAALLQSKLLAVPGIGPVLAERLLARFGSLSRMQEASLEELGQVVGAKRAEKLFEYLHG